MKHDFRVYDILRQNGKNYAFRCDIPSSLVSIILIAVSSVCGFLRHAAFMVFFFLMLKVLTGFSSLMADLACTK